jgi:hypothetical protein
MNELKRKQKEDKNMKVEKIAFADKSFISMFFVVSDWNTSRKFPARLYLTFLSLYIKCEGNWHGRLMLHLPEVRP